jgi:MmeI, DNA-methyltransferase domain/MmeI, target recognition domain
MRGIEIEQFGVDLARVTLWMGHRLAVEELDLDESTLPLADLSGIRRADALKADWGEANVIIGNPPYHGSQNLRKVLDADYVEWLKEHFDAGLKDLCVYWFRRAADQMRPGDRAGLVGTNSISQNRARGASLNYVVEKGGVITDAVSRQKWPGEAVVNVSIVNWVQGPDEEPQRFTLDGEQVEGINTRLRESKLAIEEFEPLPANLGRSFQGPIPAGSFYLEPGEAREILARDDANYAKVVRPYLIGDDITEEPTQQPRRFIVDFGFMALEEAMKYPAALDLARERVKPERDVNRDEGFRKHWWRFGRPRGEMREAVKTLSRYVAGNRIGKRFLFCWADAAVCPSDLTIVFAFDDDCSMGILTSSIHGAWAHSESSTLEDRPRYTPTSCFETFPWPQPDAEARDEIGEICKGLIERRQAICVETQIGLTDLYNQVDDGAWSEIADLHRQLDEAVARAYGWEPAIAHDPLEIKARLADLHAGIVAGASYAPF